MGDLRLSGARSVLALVVFVAALLAGTVGALVVSVPDLAYAARWEGTPGVITIRSCADVGAPRERHRRCEGTFRSDDGATVDPAAAISQRLSPGAVFPVQRTHAGGYVRVGVAAFCGWLTVALLGVTMAGALAATAAALARRSFPRGSGAALAALGGTALLSALVSAIAGAVS
ncbi:MULTISPECIES: hypothetical protein [unclassified Streptomyces]|uniref:hypothetical protein n=1 Tax=unclassified Streptomyces TaxID=2593676 RepID=UPI000B87C154|nr:MULTISPECIES: hypothetical protein [unclassified Streptomyces]MYS23764.1 hypothetical protein [Streptomyces sp. SID4948]